jgi:hypothetical protein
MSSSNLQVFSSGFLGIQGMSVLATQATQQAAISTAALAGIGPAGVTTPILAAGGVPVPAPSYLASADPDHIKLLKQNAQAACFGPDASGSQCSFWNQTLASAQASRHCPGGDIYNAIEAAKRAGAIELVRPTFVSPVLASTEPLNSVAITLTASTAPQLMS